jgi:hypothetical protein
MKKLVCWSVLAAIVAILAGPLASHAGGGHGYVGVNIGVRPAYRGPWLLGAALLGTARLVGTLRVVGPILLLCGATRGCAAATDIRATGRTTPGAALLVLLPEPPGVLPVRPAMSERLDEGRSPCEPARTVEEVTG